MSHILYYSDTCPHTKPFVEELKRLGIPYRSVNITESMPNLKAFLALRDYEPAFDGVKAKGHVGVPVLVGDGAFRFDLNSLKDLQA
ncbi:hypothetical protein CL176_08415 [Suicoccus acidiformans]|uniref:Uncharacterized protein n=1 Tax=Suicoccus acidiformans TaxID=2036206 RepID=A0A347WLR3_9LACT|nr:hypothetical protein [Suicoccus acidiformans]AXY26020.1 hypothetical protein CL176_08415 [Suicoccus acidiformans]